MENQGMKRIIAFRHFQNSARRRFPQAIAGGRFGLLKMGIRLTVGEQSFTTRKPAFSHFSYRMVAKRYSLILFSIGLFLCLFLSSATLTFAQWESTGNGVEYQRFTLPDPNNVFVTRMDRANQGVTLESSIGQGKLVSGRETVRSQAARYDQAINYWGQAWGSRNKVVAAINGSFEEPGSDVPASGQIHSGWYAKRFDDVGGGSGFAWKLDRSAFIGQCVFHRPEKQLITFTARGTTMQFDGINFTRGSDELVVYTPQYDSDTNTDGSGVEVLVEMTRPSLVLPEPAMAKGYVREIRDGQGSTPIPFDHVVLSATGTDRATLLNSVSVGDEIGISQEITQFAQGCSGAFAGDWTKTYASISGSYEFLQGGVIQGFADIGATARHPRTAIAFNDAFIFFIVVDGRDPARSVGMRIDELAQFVQSTLGASWGIAQDGGGSSTLVVNGEVKNNPSDGSERPVVNGMMMVGVEPKSQSTTFVPGEAVESSVPVDVRLGPGTNYAATTSVPANTVGTIQSHYNNLNGILATGTSWWKVSLGSAVGWVPEESLRRQVTATEVRATAVTYAKRGKNLLVTIALADNLDQPVRGASVALDLYLNGTKVASFSGTTGSTGKVTFTKKNAAKGCYTSLVTSVVATGLSWDGQTPANGFCI